jgi:hypothetical protein
LAIDHSPGRLNEAVLKVFLPKSNCNYAYDRLLIPFLGHATCSDVNIPAQAARPLWSAILHADETLSFARQRESAIVGVRIYPSQTPLGAGDHRHQADSKKKKLRPSHDRFVPSDYGSFS